MTITRVAIGNSCLNFDLKCYYQWTLNFVHLLSLQPSYQKRAKCAFAVTASYLVHYHIMILFNMEQTHHV